MATQLVSGQEKWFDIYLSSGCLPGHLEGIAVHKNLLGQAWGEKLEQQAPGFLGLDLPKPEAERLLGVLKQAGARGVMVPSSYREPTLSMDEALLRAERIIARKQATHFPGYGFSSTQLHREDAMWWIFGSMSQRLVDEGRIPGAVFAYIDKCDGHEWTSDNIERFLESQLAIRAN